MKPLIVSVRYVFANKEKAGPESSIVQSCSLCSLVRKGLFLLCPLFLCLGFYIHEEWCHTQSTWSYNCYVLLFCTFIHETAEGYLQNGEYAVRDHLGDSLHCPDSYRNLRNKSTSSLQHPYQPSCQNPPFLHFLLGSLAAAELHTSERETTMSPLQILLVSVLMKPHRTADSLGRLVTHQS